MNRDLSFIKPIHNVPISAIAGPETRGGHLKSLACFSRKVKVEHLINFLLQPNDDVHFCQLVKTDGRFQKVICALKRVALSKERWLAGCPRDNRAKWILPTRLLDQRLSHKIKRYNELKSQFRIQLRYIDKLKQGYKHFDIWLPFLSIELMNKLSNFTASEDRLILRLLLKASVSSAGKQIEGPWCESFPEEINSLCIFSLYQYEPSNKTMLILKQLNNAHCLNVGNLKAFHPEARKITKKENLSFWNNLTKELEFISDIQ